MYFIVYIRTEQFSATKQMRTPVSGVPSSVSLDLDIFPLLSLASISQYFKHTYNV